jgi:hypothetical protein
VSALQPEWERRSPAARTRQGQLGSSVPALRVSARTTPEPVAARLVPARLVPARLAAARLAAPSEWGRSDAPSVVQRAHPASPWESSQVAAVCWARPVEMRAAVLAFQPQASGEEAAARWAAWASSTPSATVRLGLREREREARTAVPAGKSEAPTEPAVERSGRERAAVRQQPAQAPAEEVVVVALPERGSAQGSAQAAAQAAAPPLPASREAQASARQRSALP